MSVTKVTEASNASTSITLLPITFDATGCDFLFLGVSQWSLTDRLPSGLWHGAESFTIHAQQTLADSGGTRRTTILKLVAPSTGTGSILVTFPGTADEVVAGATGWVGVNQTTPLGTAVINTVTGAVNSSVNVTTATGNVIHDCFSGSADTSLAATTNRTQQWHDWAASGTTEGGGATASGTGSALTFTWSDVGHGGTPSNVNIVHIGVAIQAASGGGETITVDKWFSPAKDPVRRLRAMMPSGTIGTSKS